MRIKKRDLVFVSPSDVLAAAPDRRDDMQGQSDHIPLATSIPLGFTSRPMKGRTLKPMSDEESDFISNIYLALPRLLTEQPLDAPAAIEQLVQGISDVFSRVWLTYSKEYRLTPNSKR